MALAAALTANVSLLWQDRKGGEAHMLLRFPFDTLPDTIIATVNLAVTKVQPLTLCRATKARLYYTYKSDDTTLPDEGEASRLLALFYTNGADFATIYIPGCDDAQMEQDGDYAHIRLDMSNPDVIDAVAAFTEMLTGTTLSDGSDFPPVFLVGGLVL